MAEVLPVCEPRYPVPLRARPRPALWWAHVSGGPLTNLADWRPSEGRRRDLFVIIFESDTPNGKAFDIGLIIAIVISGFVVALESVVSFRNAYGEFLRITEWVLTAAFSIEYLLRLYCVTKPLRYARSFFGMIDLLAVLPAYLSVFFPGTQYLVVVRLLRVLRVFRVLKLINYLGEADVIMEALKASRIKITVFLASVLTLSVLLGAIMYLIEGADSGFTSIPMSVYWAIVTLTTVGYGDISPATPLGQAVASVVMLLGYAIIAVPTGIVTAELTRVGARGPRVCPGCKLGKHDGDAKHCKHCGVAL